MRPSPSSQQLKQARCHPRPHHGGYVAAHQGDYPWHLAAVEEEERQHPLPGELGSDDPVEAAMATVTTMETARIRKDNPVASVCRNILVFTMVARPQLRVGLHLAHAVRCARSLCILRPPAARFAVAMRRPYSSASLRLLALAAPPCRPGSHVDRSCRPAAASTRHTLPALTCECSRYPCRCTPVPCHRSPSLLYATPKPY